MTTLRVEPITRARTGCFTCRRRKKKCDEQGAICGGCRRNQLTCTWPDSRHARPSKSKHGKPPRRTTFADSLASNPSDGPSGRSPGSDEGRGWQEQYMWLAALTMEAMKPHDPPLQTSNEVPTSEEADVNSSGSYQTPTEGVSDVEDVEITGNDPNLSAVDDDEEGPSLAAMTELIPRTRRPSLLPDLPEDSFELLSHYLNKTANSMGNGSTEVNPFVTQLIPLAFSSNLVLRLILAQSAVHREVWNQGASQGSAASHYCGSLRLFRTSLAHFLQGKEQDPLPLAVGSLVMSLTEIAKGDVTGAVFSHLKAARSLQGHTAAHFRSDVPQELKDFLVEYYIYTANLSMISLDYSTVTDLVQHSMIEHQAQDLIARSYVGSLCGCWLELIILIPSISDVGGRMLRRANESMPPAADDMTTFSLLHSQLLAYSPGPHVPRQVALAGFVFQQATLLYLMTILEKPLGGNRGLHQILIETYATEGVSYLAQIPSDARINTSLLWPIAIISSCLGNPEMQNVIRARLETAFCHLGLGNVKETLRLVEKMWLLPTTERSPWTIFKVMKDHDIWISFA